MQNSPPQIGDLVFVRRRRWRVADVRDYGACALVALSASQAEDRHSTLRVLIPFDDLQPAAAASRPLQLQRVRSSRALRFLAASAGNVDSLQCAARATLDLLAYQIEPTVALLRGHGRRLLIADAVGLGKTIEAGLAAAELLARGAVERVLVLTPAGLREQWIAELSARSGLEFALLDMRELQNLRARLPAYVNPWSTEALVVASIDYVKRAETLPAVAACRWDMVIVDEAHRVVAGERYRAAADLCARAGVVMLLTATPHSGDRVAFERLCGIGSAGDPLLSFRRTRADVGIPEDRRTHEVRVRSTPAERAMHTLVERFADAVRSEHRDAGDGALALSVLRKRAMSSACSLARTVRRRLEQLESIAPPRGEQLLLEFDDPAGEHDADQEPEWTCPPLQDSGRERALLSAIVDAAAHAVVGESKVSALKRLLRRVREPVLVFTEYRDTLLHLCDVAVPGATILHGGMSRVERRAAVEAFTHGDAPVLLATDAAGEGLNLHHRCRLVVNFELPWNPVRLAQRTGRVDRIGQRRRVHTFHLVAHGAGERAVAERLDARLTHARQDLENTLVEHLDVHEELGRLTALRALLGRRSGRVPSRPEGEPPPFSPAARPAVFVHVARRAATRAALGAAAVVVLRSQLIDRFGRPAASRLTALRVALPAGVRIRSRARVRQLAAAAASLDPAMHDAAFARWVGANEALNDAFWRACQARERAILERSAVSPGAYRQQSLFSQRASRDFASEWRRQAGAAAQFRVNAADQRRRLATVTSPVLLVLP